MAIFEFSSSNDFSSCNIYFECRGIEIIVDEKNNHFSYLVDLSRSYLSCEESGYEQTDSIYCVTTFQGKKCSI